MPWKCWTKDGCATLPTRRGVPPSGLLYALILARTGDEPRTSGRTARMIRQLRGQDSTLESLRLRYGARQYFLHGRCFYDGILEPQEDIVRDVRETTRLHSRR